MQLNKPIVDIVAHPSGLGYWLVAADGGVFAFGAAPSFPDPVPTLQLNAPVVGAACTPSGNGLWLTAGDGGIFRLGDDAGDHGSIPALPG